MFFLDGNLTKRAQNVLPIIVWFSHQHCYFHVWKFLFSQVLGTVCFLLVHFIGTQVQVFFTCCTVNFIIFSRARHHAYFSYLIFIFYFFHFFFLLTYHLPICVSYFLPILFKFFYSHIVLIHNPINWNYVRLALLIKFLLSFSFLHHLNAQGWQKVHCFTHIITLWKTAMVSWEKCTYVVVWSLVGFVNWNTNLNQL